MRIVRLLQIIAIFVLLGLSISNAMAQTVGYTYRPLAAEGCNMQYSIAQQNGEYFIIATVKSDRLTFLKESSFWLKTTDGEIIKLQGEVIGGGSESAGIVSGNIVIPITEISSTAQFRISEEELEKLNQGIIKVRLSTTPIEHERTFKKDKVGKKLYQFYQKKKMKDDDF